MAKDKDKQLFRNVDDKAITFQRAVFIVCNLKRLIKRPKKDDKHSSGTRKKSGDTDFYSSERSSLGLLASIGAGGGGVGSSGSGAVVGGVGGCEGVAGCGTGQDSAGAPLGRLRFSNPIRRAFTLPTIICGSFADLGGPGTSATPCDAHTQPDCDAICDRHQRIGADGGERDATDGDGCEEVSWLLEAQDTGGGQRVTIDGVQSGGKLQFWPDDQIKVDATRSRKSRQQHRFVIQSSPSRDGGVSGRSCERSSTSAHTLSSSPTNTLSRQASPVSFGGFERCGTLAGATMTTTAARTSGGDLRAARRQDRAQSAKLSDNLSSLSCLVTPKRRAATAVGPKVVTPSAALSSGCIYLAKQQQEQQPQQRPDATLATTSATSGRYQQTASTLYHRHLEPAPRSSGPANETGATGQGRSAFSLMATSQQQLQEVSGQASTMTNSGASDTLRTTSGSWQQQTFCPIWALAMELLDANQSQPRDQGAESHLLGPPSALPYLLAPQQRACLEQARLFDASSKGAARVGRSEQTSRATTSEFEKGAGRRTDGGGLVIRDNRRDGVDSDERGAGCLAGLEDDEADEDRDDEPEGDGEEEEDTNEDPNYRERMRMKRFSSSALCLNDDKSQHGQQRQQHQYHKRHQQHEHHRKDKHLRIDGGQQCFDMPKRQILGSRFKSKLNSDTDQERSSEGHSRTRTQLARKQQQSSAVNLLSPEDPIVQLARQRRPSVSNQGSVNVDQQALFSAVECNQLERAKTILDNGKVNVNSLNGDKLTCLDVAVLLRNSEMAKLLQRYQAKESSAFLTREGRENQLYALYMEARRLVEDLSHSIEAILPSASRQGDSTAPADSHQQLQSKSGLSSSAFSAASSLGTNDPQQHQQHQQQQQHTKGSLLSAALIEEKQRQLQYWRRRLDLFMQMRYSFDKLDIPSAPELVVLQVVGENSLGVKIVHSLDSFNQLLHHNRNKPPRPAAVHEHQLVEQRADGSELPRATLNKLPNLVRERGIICSLGLKCSHWLMDEYLALKRTDHILNASSTMNSWLVGQRQLSTLDPPQGGQQRHSRTTTATSCVQQQQQQQQQHQMRLAVFNHLLAQQLALLSSEQRQQEERELYEHNNYFRLKKWAQMRLKRRQQQQEEEDLACHQQQRQSGSSSRAADAPNCQLDRDEQVQATAHAPTQAERLSWHQSQLMSSHQTESTDSAYDYIAAVASRQQLQQQLSMLAINPAAYAAPPLQLGQPTSGGEASTRGQLQQALIGSSAPAAARNIDESLKMMSCVPAQSGAFQQVVVPYHSLAYQLMSARRHNNNFCEEASAPRHHQQSAKKSCGCGPSAAVAATAVTAATAATAVAAAIASNPAVSDSSGNNVIVITKYKIEWSLNEHFEPIVDSMIIYNTNSYPIECHINNLTNGELYYVRVSSGNQKGFSEARCTTPACLAPSSWRQVALHGPAHATPANAGPCSSAATSANSAPRTRATSSKKSSASSWLSSSSTKRKVKYDEKVFRKFTKLILLNKHILDANQVNQLQREQHLMAMDKNYRPGRGLAGSKLGASLQNKSSLINMLLLDATMQPTSRANRGGEHDSTWNGNDGSATGESGNSLNTFSMTITAHSPRGSLYPIETNNRSSVSGSSASQYADQQDQLQQQQQQQQVSSLKVKKNFKSFFQSNSAKFHKLNNQNKRGLYLATVIYSTNQPSANKSASAANTKQQQQQQSALSGMEANKIVVTNDDRLPIIEIMNDLVSSSALMGDFYWLLKINGTKWIDIKRLRQQLQKSHSSSTLYLRIKLLNAIEQMQQALNLEDIGRLFYKPIQAHDGSIVICTCKHVSSVKLVSNLSIKWTNQNKLMPRHLRKISDTISQQTSQQRQQEQQQEQQQQHFLQCNLGPAIGKRNASTVSMPASHHQYQETSSQAVLAMPTGQSGSGSEQRDQQGAGGQLTAAAFNLVASSNVVSSAVGLAPSNHSCSTTSKSAQANNQQQQHQHDSLHLLSASNAPLPAELVSRLCESCQLTLSQRRCTMTSGSSSSSLASNESQSTWSSSQFSLTSRHQQLQPQQQPARSCTCSRSNSASVINLQHQARPNQAPGGHGNQLATTSAHTGQSLQTGQSVAVSVSAPGSQRNSTAARSSSGSFATAPNSHSAHPASLSGTAGGSSFSLYSGQSQHMSSSMAPQKSSTYLMLASLSLYDLLLFHLNQIIEFDQTSTEPLKRGLYLGFVQLQTTVESMRLLVPRKRPNMIPCTRIRDNAHVSREEWQLLKQFGHLVWGADKQKHQHQRQRQRQQQQQQPAVDSTKSSSRLSDPAIWSGANRSGAPEPQVKLTSGAKFGDSATEEARQQQQQQPGGVDQSRLLGTGSIGLDSRNRAKSVSPGLMTMGAGKSAEVAASPTLDPIGEAKLMAVSLKNQLSSTTNNDTGSTALATNLGPPQQQVHSCSVTDLKSGLVELSAAPAASCAQNQSDTNLCKTGQAKQAAGASDGRQVRGASSICGTSERAQADQDREPLVGSSAQLSSQSCCQSPEMTFVRLIGDAAKRLLCELKSQLPKVYDVGQDSWLSVLASLNDEENNRVYHLELIELSNQVTFVLLIPAPENVCPVTSHEKSTMLTNNNSEYMLLPLQIFETIHLNTYEPDLLGKYSRLSTILETDLIVAQHEHRQAFSSSELKSTKSRVSHLQDMVSIADEFWRQLRWIVDVVSFARDKSHYNTSSNNIDLTASSGSQTLAQSLLSGCIRVGTIWRHFDNLSMSSRWSGATKTSDELIRSELALKRRQEQRPAKLQQTNNINANDDSADDDENNKPEIMRTLSAHRRNQGQNTRALNNSSKSTNRHHSSSITTMNCLDQHQHQHQGPPPRLPQIQLPSSELRGDEDDDELEASSVLVHKTIGRHLSADPGGPKKETRPSGADELVESGARTSSAMAYDSRYSLETSSVDSMRHRSSGGQCQEAADCREDPLNEQQQQQQQQQHWPSDIGEDSATASDTTSEIICTDNVGEQADDGHESTCCCVEERIFNVDFGPVVLAGDESDARDQVMEHDHDEEAIYAYHLSFRDKG